MVERTEITDEELSALTNAIKTRYGLDFTEYEMKSLKRGFARLMMKHKITSLLDLWKQVLRDRSFIFNCIDDLTVNLTELFRNPEFWVYLQRELLPEFNRRPLKVWHAGCSTGEEVYSLKITCSMSGVLSLKQVATDLNLQVLEHARQGAFTNMLHKKYKAKFKEAFPNAHFSNYWDLTDDKFKIKDRYQKNIEFSQHNLVQDTMHQKFDIIFCRNVLIYFDEKLKLKVLDRFRKALNPNGFLIMGYYDVMPNGYESYFHVHHSRCRVYKLSQNETKTLHFATNEQASPVSAT